MDENIAKKLCVASREALNNAYCPYSNFPVGASLLCIDGTIFKGCNVENAGYSGTICAERTAFVKAVSEGHTSFKAIAISSNINEHFITPCGNCRQFMSEFGIDLIIYLVKPDLSYKITSLRELLPMAFGPQELSYIKVNNNN